MTIPSEKDKVFLEVHIQNSSQQPLYFEQMRFECVEGWEVQDANVAVDDDGQEQSIYPNSMSLIQPQDTRQYVYILSPKVTVLTPLTYAPGSVVPLGRLNIAWRSLFGEPGRLLTSILSRRIPLTTVPPQQQASALPSHLKRSMAGSILSRPQSPQSMRSRPSTPTGQRASSPPPVPRTIPFSSTLMGRQSPNPTPSQIPTTELETTLIVRHVPRDEIVIEKPFTVKLALVISHSREQGQRAIKIAIQHLQPPRVTRTASTMDAVNTRLLSSGTATPTSTVGGFSPAIVQQNLLSTRTSLVDDATTTKIAQQLEGIHDQANLPSPTFDGADELGSVSAHPGVVYVGPSTIFLPPVALGTKTQNSMPMRQVVQEFEISYVPLRKGFTSFGGLRALLVEDRIIVGTGDEDMSSMIGREKISTLKEWDTIGDIWVASGK